VTDTNDSTEGLYVIADVEALKKAFVEMRAALAVADSVLEKSRFTGTDQNPKGVRDLVGYALGLADKVKVP
jgi:hypothetical protein